MSHHQPYFGKYAVIFRSNVLYIDCGREGLKQELINITSPDELCQKLEDRLPQNLTFDQILGIANDSIT